MKAFFLFNLILISITLVGSPVHALEQLTNNEVRQIMIEESNQRGSCPCPYSPNKLGGICGTESTYYRPGGYKVYCYLLDIPSEEVHFYRLKRS